MRAIAVVGSSFGDEGKGAAVDKLTSANPNSLVVRFNGSGQAGHKVTLPDGRRHIFSHFCSGALAGAPSHLSEYFVVNPRIFVAEHAELTAFMANTYLTVDPKALITTPLDVAINRALETKRGAGRHGSVGIGFGETIGRSERGFPLYAHDIVNSTVLKRKIARLLIEWASFRTNELNIGPDIIGIDWDEYFFCCEHFTNEALLMPFQKAVAAARYKTIIFEGAQGLLLDQVRGMTFPHVTRSNTGLQNVMPLLDQLEINELRVIYMMRPYLTRHGAGPLPGEVKELSGIKVVDETNTTKPWQEHLRFAPFDADIIKFAIDTDLAEARAIDDIKIDPYIGISCVDQGKPSDLLKAVQMGFPLALHGHGPRRDQYQLRKDFKTVGVAADEEVLSKSVLKRRAAVEG